MIAFRAFVERYAVAAYAILAIVISWGCLALAVGAGTFPATAEQLESVTAGLAILAGPALAALLLTAWFTGPSGLRGLLSRLVRWRVPMRWYALALLVAPVVAVAASFALAVLDRRFLPTILTSGDKAGMLVTAVASGVMIGLLEELGWTGFAVPRLRRRHDVLATGLTVGLLWGVWHFPLFWGSDTFASTLGLGLLLARLFSWLPPFRVLMVWIHDRSDSLLVVVLMHVSLVMSTLLLQPTVTGSSLLVYILVWAAALWAASFAVTTATGQGQPERTARKGTA